jgi:hypothetical protein
MLRLEKRTLDAPVPSRIQYRENVLRFSQIPARVVTGIVTINRWTLELADDGRIVGMDCWLPILTQSPIPWRRFAPPTYALVRLLPNYDCNRRDSCQREPESHFFDPAAGTFVVLWSDADHLEVYRCAENLSVVSDATMQLAGAILYAVPAGLNMSQAGSQGS